MQDNKPAMYNSVCSSDDHAWNWALVVYPNGGGAFHAKVLSVIAARPSECKERQEHIVQSPMSLIVVQLVTIRPLPQWLGNLTHPRNY
jgi:hypothetical protein